MSAAVVRHEELPRWSLEGDGHALGGGRVPQLIVRDAIASSADGRPRRPTIEAGQQRAPDDAFPRPPRPRDKVGRVTRDYQPLGTPTGRPSVHNVVRLESTIS